MNKAIIFLGLALCFAVLEITRVQATSIRPVCGPKMEYRECANNCPLTCANKDNPPMCVQACLKSECQCLSKYVLNEQGSCVLPEECPKKVCGPNMEYKKCINNCHLTCDNKDRPPVCAKDCRKSGCQCLPKYVLNARGSCVLPKECIKKGDYTG